MYAVKLWSEGRARATDPPEGKAALHCDVKARAGGTDVTYTPKSAGEYVLEVYLEGRPIGGSPFTVVVYPGEPDAGRSICRASTGEVGKLNVLAGEPGTIRIDARDSVGNLREGRGDAGAYAATLEGPMPDDPALAVSAPRTETLRIKPEGEEDEEGRYCLSVGPTRAGRYVLSIACGGAHVAGSPVDVRVFPGLLDGPHSQVAVAAGPAGGVAGQGALLAILARDAYSNLRSGGADELDFEVKIVKGDAPPPEHTLRDMGEGGYALEFKPTVAGNVEVHVSVAGVALSGSPVIWPVTPGPLFGPACTFECDLESRPAAGELVWARVLAKDRYGNVRTEGDDFQFLSAQIFARAPFAPLSQHCGPAKEEPVKIEALGEGVYTASVALRAAGDYDLEIRFGKDAALIQDCPLPIRIYPGPPVGTSCSLLRGPPEGAAPAGQPLSWALLARDLFGNLRGPGFDDSSQFVARLVGESHGNVKAPEVPVNVKPIKEEPGAYELSAAPQAAGEYALHVEVAREAVPGSPFRAMVVPGPPDPNKTKVDAGGRKDSEAGDKFALKLTVCDAYGNPREAGGDADEIEVSLEGPGENKGGHPKAVPLEKALYEIPLELDTTGEYKIMVAIAGKGPLAGTPIKWKVKPAALDPAASTLELVPVPGLAPGAPRQCGPEPVRAVVKMRDGSGNPRPKGADAGLLAVRVAGAATGGAAVEIRPSDVKSLPSFYSLTDRRPPRKVEAGPEGEYAVSFAATVAAKYEDNAVPSELADGGDGVYGIMFVPERAGQYTVNVEIDKKAAGGSPLQLPVGAALPYGPHCRVKEAAPAEAEAAAELACVVEVRDKYGNARAGFDDAALLAAELRPLGGPGSGAVALKAKVEKIPDTPALYRVSCTPERVDPEGFEFSVKVGSGVDAIQVPGALFRVLVRPGALDPAACRVTAGDGGGASWAGEPLKISAAGSAPQRVPLQRAAGFVLLGEWTPKQVGPHTIGLEGGASIPWAVHPETPAARDG
eukprot:tig00021521_g22071.t1